MWGSSVASARVCWGGRQLALALPVRPRLFPLFPPTRRFVFAPFPVTLLSHLRGNPELFVKG